MPKKIFVEPDRENRYILTQAKIHSSVTEIVFSASVGHGCASRANYKLYIEQINK
jgi:hypothetical protein